jgi:hypothetical protein
MDLIARNIDDLTPQWFTTVLQDGGAAGAATTVAHADTQVIGTGQMGMVTRTRLTYQPGNDGPTSVIVKLPSTDAGSRQLGVAAGICEAEVRFYQEIAPTVDIRMPALYWADLEAASGRFTLVLEDLGADAEVGDMIAGATSAQIDVAFEALIGLQAPRWNDPDLAATPWIADLARTEMLFGTVAAAVAPFEARFADRLEPRHVELIRQIAPHAPEVAQLIWQPPLVICHGDYRLDNMLFGRSAAAPAFAMIDWQCTRLGPPLLDAAIFMASCVDVDARRGQQDHLLESYHKRLVDAGISGFSLQDAWESYRRCSLYPLLIATAMSVTVEQTERGDAMWVRLVRGAAELVLDTSAEQIVG